MRYARYAQMDPVDSNRRQNISGVTDCTAPPPPSAWFKPFVKSASKAKYSTQPADASGKIEDRNGQLWSRGIKKLLPRAPDFVQEQSGGDRDV